MKKTIIILFSMISFVFANVDYSEMSDQELIAIMGYVKDKNKKEFIKELKSRTSTMSEKEKATYKNNLKKLKR